jgi:hypothetical protein
MVDIDDADGKPKWKASPKSKLLPSDASSPYVGISPPSHRKEAGHHRLNEDEGDARQTLVRGRGLMLIVSTI